MGSYAGDINAAEAWEILSHDSHSVLIDVRTPPEWQFAGAPDLSLINKNLVKLSWRNYPSYELNHNFVDGLKSLDLANDNKLLFLCKTGGRSAEAAELSATLGFTNSFNIADGMEGPANASGQRGKIAGWKAANLPWRQD